MWSIEAGAGLGGSKTLKAFTKHQLKCLICLVTSMRGYISDDVNPPPLDAVEEWREGEMEVTTGN